MALMASTSVLRGLPLAARTVTCPVRGPTLRRSLTTTPALHREADQRPASAQLFTASDVQSGIAALSAAGYHPASVWEQRVVWGDHDQFQHVNNVHFVRWFESARMFFAHCLTQSAEFSDARREEITRGTGKSFILAGINVRYRRPVLYPDTVSRPPLHPPPPLASWKMCG